MQLIKTSTPEKTPRLERLERLEARISPEQKALLKRAATLEGRSLTDFILASVAEAARRTIEEHERLTLSTRDREAFVAALLNPPAPNAALRAAARRYRRQVEK